MGRYTQVALFEERVAVDFQGVVIKQLQIQGSICHSWQTWRQLMDFLEKGRIDFRPLISSKLPLDRWDNGFASVQNKQAIKVLLYPET